MRVRTALVTPNKASGVEAIFARAVGRHLAWVVGNGHVYADLGKTARRHGYVFRVSDNDPAFWVAVREDLVGGLIPPGDNQIFFETRRPGLGDVIIAKGDESQSMSDRDLVFYLNEDDTISFVVDERIAERSRSIVPIEFEDFTYIEYLYSVTPLNH